MLDILRDYLTEAAGPEVTQMISDAHEQFDRFGMDNYDEGFAELLMVDDETDTGNTITGIINLTRELLDGLLHQHGVRLVQDTTIRLRTDVVRALQDIPDYSDKQALIAIVQTPGDACERFSEVLALVTKYTPEGILPNLEFVSHMLIQKILDTVNEDLLQAQDDADRIWRAARILKFKNFMDANHQTESAIQQLVYRGVDAGFPFKMYLNIIEYEFEGTDPDLAAINLIGMALLSTDGYENPMGCIEPHLEHMISDPMNVTKVAVAIRNKLVEFAQHE